MRRRLSPVLRLSLALLLALAVPVGALAGLNYYLKRSVRADMEQRVEATLDMAINLEESLLGEGLADMHHAAMAAAADPGVVAALSGDHATLNARRFLDSFLRADMVVIVDRQGLVRARATSDHAGDQVLLDGLVTKVMSEGHAAAYPTLISPAELASEGSAIHQLVDMPILKAGGSTDLRIGTRVDTALALAGVAPIRSPEGEVVGAAIVADVLNRDFRIVDEVAKWAPAGTPMNATIAMDGVRVTTNVKLRDPEGNEFEHRALGTVYSDAVMQSLKATGVHHGRADVVGQWQRTIYRALTDYQGHMIAAPYVGIPEEYFATASSQLTISLQRIATVGGGFLLVSLLLAMWLSYRGLAAQAVLNRWRPAAERMQGTAAALGAALEPLEMLAGAKSPGTQATPAAVHLRTGAAEALEQVQQLSQAIQAISEGVRSEERSIHYVGRVAQEIADGLQESRTTVDAAVADAGQLAASARAALRQAGEFAAGLAVLRQAVSGGMAQHGLDLLRDPSDMLAGLSTLSDRVVGEVRTLVLMLQENQARLAFIREEMNRVSAVVRTTSASTQAAAQSAGQAIGWMEGMADTAVSVADEVSAARAGLEAAAAANRHLLEWCGRVQELVRQVQSAAAELEPKA